MSDIMKMGKNPNYLGSWDLDDAPNRELVLTIKNITDEEVVNSGQKEIQTVCRFYEQYKPMILNVTNKKTLCRLYKTKDTDKLAGKRITVMSEKVKAFGAIHDALRIKNAVPSAPVHIKCEGCGNDILAYGGMSAEQMAQYTKAKYGKSLCAECAKSAAAQLKEDNGNENNEN